MTQRSQHRTHAGKRAAAQRRARREGYAMARFAAQFFPDAAPDIFAKGYPILDEPRSPHRVAAFRRGAQGFADKHGGRG